MKSQDFSEIAKRYRETSIIQSSAADILFALLAIEKGESVLDVGCGTGNLTKKIYDISHGHIVGIDPSDGMVEESKNRFGGEIAFQTGSMEEMAFNSLFDVIFCNSTFQWARNAQKAARNFHSALRPHGRIGIQAPAKKEYCPNFIRAVKGVQADPELRKVFSHFNSPWFFLDTAQEYADLFLREGFTVPLCEIQTIETFHTPDEVYAIFSSGAIAGYLNNAYYTCDISEKYIDDCKNVIRKEFKKQATHDGRVRLIFNRIFLVGIKE